MTSLEHQSTIADCFDFRNRNANGSFRMYEWRDTSRDRLYLLNQHGRKLLQLIIKDEPHSTEGVPFAQIKMIPYGIAQAKIYRDQLDDPHLLSMSSDLEFTYHGGPKGDQMPKIHLKIVSPSKEHYETLVDCSLSLNSNLPRLAPICSLFAGSEFDKPAGDRITKKSHIFKADSVYPVRFDIYLSGKSFDHQAYMNTIYSLNMFFSLDYLISSEGGPLRGLPMVQPITGFAMRDYRLWIRCSKSLDQDTPFMQFYNNASYYDKFMNRRSAWIGEDGLIHWSTMLDEENATTS